MDRRGAIYLPQYRHLRQDHGAGGGAHRQAPPRGCSTATRPVSSSEDDLRHRLDAMERAVDVLERQLDFAERRRHRPRSTSTSTTTTTTTTSATYAPGKYGHLVQPTTSGITTSKTSMLISNDCVDPADDR